LISIAPFIASSVGSVAGGFFPSFTETEAERFCTARSSPFLTSGDHSDCNESSSDILKYTPNTAITALAPSSRRWCSIRMTDNHTGKIIAYIRSAGLCTLHGMWEMEASRVSRHREGLNTEKGLSGCGKTVFIP
jgi:hypothetical protein